MLFRDDHDRAVCSDVFRLFEYAPELGPPLSDPKVMLDLGAFAGYSTLGMRWAYPTAIVFAVELDPGNYAALYEQTLEDHMVRPLNAAIWSGNGRVGSASHLMGNARHAVPGGEDVPAYTLDTVIDFFKLRDLGGVDFVKMDIEGAEKYVLEDEQAVWPGIVRHLKIELHGYDSGVACNHLRNFGYTAEVSPRRYNVIEGWWE